ncbi:hypothetical protein MGN70_001559 [Eutypa lata]|nr:hypothetical protein MGN70_001559 [Eutypa lata]
MTPSTKVQYTRTFTGCRTCRSRHAKCDEAQPVCGTCQRLGLDCGGYGSRLFWITDEVPPSLRQEQHQSHRNPEYRYPLFSELDRRLMSDELSDSLGGCSPLRILADIDNACEKIEGTDRTMTSLAKGPFSVFQVVEPSLDAQPPTPEPTPSSPSSSDVINVNFVPDELAEEDRQQDWTDRLCDETSDLFAEALDPSIAFNTHDHGSSDRLLLQGTSVTNQFFSDGPIEDTQAVDKIIDTLP